MKVILDRTDNVILNFGDIITHQAIQRAHEAGGLDSLLGSVYRATVELSMKEMRVPVAADATVERAAGGAEIVDDLERKLETAERERRAEQERKRIDDKAARPRRARDRFERRAARDAERQQRESAEGELATASAASPRQDSPRGGPRARRS
jgi:hypothetical protein